MYNNRWLKVVKIVKVKNILVSANLHIQRISWILFMGNAPVSKTC